jgi:hypothetical protein
MAIQINKTELLNILVGIKKPTIIHMKTVTVPKVRVNNIFHNDLKKVSQCNFMVLTNYKNRVNNNRKKENKETNFVPQHIRGREHISECVCTDSSTQSKYYLMVERFAEIKSNVTYFYNNNVVDKNLVEPLLIGYSQSTTQQLQRQVNVLTYSLDSIKEITINKNKYIIL